jgi:L-lactate utilization protein LutC
MTSLYPDYQIFLLADEEVLQNLDLSVLKVMQADDDLERYYAWMTMNPGSIINL